MKQPVSPIIRPVRAVAVLVLLAVIALVVAVTFVVWDLRNRELEHSRIEMVSLTEMLLAQTRQTFDSADLVLVSIQERLQSTYGKQFALDSLPVHLLLGARISGMPHVKLLFLVDAQGNVVNTSREHPLPSTSVADRDYYQTFAAGGQERLFIGKPVVGRSDGEWTIHLARRLSGPDGEFRGVVALSLNLAHFEQVFDFTKLDFERPIALYLDDGTLVASIPRRDAAIGQRAVELQNIDLSFQEAGVQHHARLSAELQKESFTLARLEKYPLLVSVSSPEEDALASWRETATPVAIGAGLVGIFIVVVALLLGGELKREESLSQALRMSDERYLQTVESTNQQLRSLSAALQDVREEERTRLSRELHDELGQQLTGLKLDLAWLGNRVRDGRAAEPARVDEMRELLDRAIASVRRISSDLRPPVLDDLGFGAAVGWLKQQTEKRSGIAIDLDMPAEACVTTPALATALYRIVQEALTNILRHADATQVAIRLAELPGKIVLTIRDNGKGLDEEQDKPGIGLVSMRERVAALGGEFSIISLPGQGVAIEVSVPLQQLELGELAT